MILIVDGSDKSDIITIEANQMYYFSNLFW
jgi:hypothetical protein